MYCVRSCVQASVGWIIVSHSLLANGAYRWTHRLRGCLSLEPLSSGRCPAAPSSARESVLGTGESWWLAHRRRRAFRGHTALCIIHHRLPRFASASVYGGAATWLRRRQAAVRCGTRQGDNDGTLLIGPWWADQRTEAEEELSAPREPTHRENNTLDRVRNAGHCAAVA